MEIWIDSAEISFLEKVLPLGFFTGITTNPSILASHQGNIFDTGQNLLSIQSGPVCIQSQGTNYQEFVSFGEELQSKDERYVIKIPAIQEGFHAITELTHRQIPSIATAIYKPRQYLLAGLAGACYAAPYVGRMRREGIEIREAISEMQAMQLDYFPQTKILAAGVEDWNQFAELIELGVECFTLKKELVKELIADEPLTLQAIEEFKTAGKK